MQRFLSFGRVFPDASSALVGFFLTRPHLWQRKLAGPPPSGGAPEAPGPHRSRAAVQPGGGVARPIWPMDRFRDFPRFGAQGLRGSAVGVRCLLVQPGNVLAQQVSGKVGVFGFNGIENGVVMGP
jgi:hypothetical protein